MYQAFYNLKADPFRLSPDHRFCYVHEGFARARAYMAYAFMRAEGFILVTGRPGTGKTILIDELLASLADESVHTANLVCTQLQADDLLRMVAYSFGVDRTIVGKGDLLRKLDNLFRHWRREGERALLVVDEAQDLSEAAIEELRLLSNIQDAGKPLLQIFLVGQPELRDLMHSPAMEQVHQRIIAASHLEALQEQETENYIIHRLKKAGWRGDPRLSNAIFPLIYKFSEGVPRRINLICSRLFLLGSVEQHHDIGLAVLREVILDLQRENLAAGYGISEEDFEVEDEFVYRGHLSVTPAPTSTQTANVETPDNTANSEQELPVAAVRAAPLGEEFIGEESTAAVISVAPPVQQKAPVSDKAPNREPATGLGEQTPARAQASDNRPSGGKRREATAPATRKMAFAANRTVQALLLIGLLALLPGYWLLFGSGFGHVSGWVARAGQWWTSQAPPPGSAEAPGQSAAITAVPVTPAAIDSQPAGERWKPDPLQAQSRQARNTEVPAAQSAAVADSESAAASTAASAGIDVARVSETAAGFNPELELESGPEANPASAAPAVPTTETAPASATEAEPEPEPEPFPAGHYSVQLEFAVDSTELPAEAAVQLDEIATLFIKSGLRRGLVVRYPESGGGENYDKTLSRRRAETVAYRLISKGVDAGQLALKGSAALAVPEQGVQERDAITQDSARVLQVAFDVLARQDS